MPLEQVLQSIMAQITAELFSWDLKAAPSCPRKDKPRLFIPDSLWKNWLGQLIQLWFALLASLFLGLHLIV